MNTIKTNRMIRNIPFLVSLTIAIWGGIALSGCNQAPAPQDTPSTAATIIDPLPSWNEGTVKQSILDFVAATTNESDADYLPPTERIAVFDNDGTLWSEQPLYFQLFFIFDRVKELASEHPEWKDDQPFKAVLENDMAYLTKMGLKELLQLVMTTHAGMSPEQFEAISKTWFTRAKHPRFDRLYTACVFQPMLEVLAYMRANGFKTFIVSGGGIEFVRAFSEEIYGIPPEQVVGSSIKTRFEIKDGKADLIRLPEINFIDDKEEKPVGINQFIGRRPAAAFGNSDGDLAMLQYTASGPGKRLLVIVHHDDDQREYAYDRESPIGHLDKALDEAREKGWTVASIKEDWKSVFPLE